MIHDRARTERPSFENDVSQKITHVRTNDLGFHEVKRTIKYQGDMEGKNNEVNGQNLEQFEMRYRSQCPPFCFAFVMIR